jgi:hypothetical protein
MNSDHSVPSGPVSNLVIEILDESAPGSAHICYCIADTASGAAGAED